MTSNRPLEQAMADASSRPAARSKQPGRTDGRMNRRAARRPGLRLARSGGVRCRLGTRYTSVSAPMQFDDNQGEKIVPLSFALEKKNGKRRGNRGRECGKTRRISTRRKVVKRRSVKKWKARDGGGEDMVRRNSLASARGCILCIACSVISAIHRMHLR